MKFLQYLTISTITFLTLTACGKEHYKFKLNPSQKNILGKNASIKIDQLTDETIDSIQLFVGKTRVPITNNISKFNTNNIGVGRHEVTALIFTPNMVKKVSDSLKIYANVNPKGYKYEVVNRYTHDKNAYTQGLEFHNGALYETTGRVGKSWLRKIDYKTGKVLQQKDLGDYFGEGMTVANNQIYWLTWLGGKGFTFNPQTFEKTGDFKYDESQQGWGLTHDEQHLIKSDGSNKLYFLNYDGKEQKVIQAYTIFRDKGQNPRASNIDQLNEIEYVGGKIYANRWQTEQIAIIDAKTGILNGIVNLKALKDEIAKEQTLDNDEVLNGIAYNPETKTFFVTGKHWRTLFEIKIIE